MTTTYFKWDGFSINEGGRVNLHISWFWEHHWFFFYVAIFMFNLTFAIWRKNGRAS